MPSLLKGFILYIYTIDFLDRDGKRKEIEFYETSKYKTYNVMKKFRKKLYDPGKKIKVFRIWID